MINFEKLFQENQGFIFRYLMKLCGNESLAEELTQETFFRAYMNLTGLRKEVGLVFQYPEHQLFGQTVLADTCFGPKNLGMSKEEAEASAKRMLELVGIGEEY